MNFCEAMAHSPIELHLCISFRVYLLFGREQTNFKECETTLAQQVSKPPEQDELPSHTSQPLIRQHTRLSMAGIVCLLVLLGVVILSSTGLLVMSLVRGTSPPVAQVGTGTPISQQTQVPDQTGTPTQAHSPAITPTATPPIFRPGNTLTTPLQVPGGHFIIYEQQNYLYMISTAPGAAPQLLSTPGYVYDHAVPPILTPTGQLLYSGEGIWLADIFSGTANQLATLDPNQVITSMALSSDGTTIAWTTEPSNGNGMDNIYAGALDSPTKVFEQASTNCPCFRIFSFMNGSGKQGNTTLLLTDGQQSLEAIQFGLWSFNITKPLATPQSILDGDSQQGPLSLAPYGNTLLYSTYEAQVPVPTDESVPNDLATLNYANSLNVATLQGQPLTLSAPRVILSKQQELSNHAAYHWVTTPIFTPDAQTLVYVEFSSQAQAPYDRSSALYVAHIGGTGQHLSVGKPQLLATSTAGLLELGTWLNSHELALYADNAIYVLDVQSGAVATIVQTGAYARVIAVIGQGGI